MESYWVLPDFTEFLPSFFWPALFLGFLGGVWVVFNCALLGFNLS